MSVEVIWRAVESSVAEEVEVFELIWRETVKVEAEALAEVCCWTQKAVFGEQSLIY